MKSTTGSFNETDLITSALLIEIFRAYNTAYSKKLNKTRLRLTVRRPLPEHGRDSNSAILGTCVLGPQ